MSDAPPLPFEQALRKLEEIVARLEKGELTLEESLSLYEQGIGLARQCHAKLEEAEGRIEVLIKDARGGLVTDAKGQPRSRPLQADEDDDGPA